MSNVSDPLYNDLTKTGDCWTKLSPTIKFDVEYEVSFVACILKSSYNTLSKVRTYDIKVRPYES